MYILGNVCYLREIKNDIYFKFFNFINEKNEVRKNYNDDSERLLELLYIVFSIV